MQRRLSRSTAKLCTWYVVLRTHFFLVILHCTTLSFEINDESFYVTHPLATSPLALSALFFHLTLRNVNFPDHPQHCLCNTSLWKHLSNSLFSEFWARLYDQLLFPSCEAPRQFSRSKTHVFIKGISSSAVCSKFCARFLETFLSTRAAQRQCWKANDKNFSVTHSMGNT